MSDNFFKMVKALKADAMLEQEDGNGNLQEYFSEPRAAAHLRENFIPRARVEQWLKSLVATGLASSGVMAEAAVIHKLREILNHD